jgi:hypothetical protein
MTLEGNRLIKKTAVTNASSQNFKGILACARRVSPTSTMWQCFRSAEPFCWCAWGHDTWCEIPMFVKNVLKARYSPPIRLNRPDFSVKLTFNKGLEIMKNWKDFRFLAKQINPREFTIIIDETNIVFILTNWIRSRPPYIEKNKI